MFILKGFPNLPSEKKIIKIFPQNITKELGSFAINFAGNPFIQKFIRNLKDNLLIEPNSKILVGVSGGVDSVALLDALYCTRHYIPFEIAIAHLNHLLRGEESDADEELVKELAEKYGLLLFLQRTNVKEFAEKHSLNLEEGARIVRYDFFRRASQSFSAKYIATAHNANDQAETVLFNLFRGTGIAGLRGIAEKNEISKGLYLIRPFLNFTREEIQNYAITRNLTWREDSSNQSLQYVRNRIRLQLIPLLQKDFNPNILENLNRTAKLAREVQRIVSNQIQSLYDRFVIERNSKEIELQLQGLQHFDDFLIGELLQEIVRKNFDELLSFGKIQELKKLFNANPGKVVSLQKNLFAFKNRDKIFFIQREILKSKQKEIVIKKTGHFVWFDSVIELTEVPTIEFRIDPDPNVEFFDYDKVAENIVVRTWKESDRFVPLGMKKSIKLSDFFVNQKVPVFRKEEYPLFVSNGEIFWVGGLRISERFKVTKRTKRVLKGVIKKLNWNENDSSF